MKHGVRGKDHREYQAIVVCDEPDQMVNKIALRTEAIYPFKDDEINCHTNPPDGRVIAQVDRNIPSFSSFGGESMHKHGVIVWLRSIQYTGGNVGSDTEFDMDVSGTQTHVSVDMKCGTTRLFDLPVFMQVVTNEETRASVAVQVVEEREPVPDRAAMSQDYVIRPVQGRQSLGPHTITVRENLGILGTGALADFIFTFEAEHFQFDHLGIRYVAATEKGWLLVLGENGAKDFSLPQGLQVQVTRTTRDREFFRVIEGPDQPTVGRSCGGNTPSREHLIAPDAMVPDYSWQIYHFSSTGSANSSS